MTTIRVSKRTRFTVIDRATVNDDRISFRARGVLAWLLDKPDDWATDSNAIARAASPPKGEGRDAVRAALKELEEFGYLTRDRKRDAAGRWSTEVFVLERPAPENPSLDPHFDTQPGPENPASENQALNTKDCSPTTDVVRENEDLVPLSELPKTKAPWVLAGLSWREWNDLNESEQETVMAAQS